MILVKKYSKLLVALVLFSTPFLSAMHRNKNGTVAGSLLTRQWHQPLLERGFVTSQNLQRFGAFAAGVLVASWCLYKLNSGWQSFSNMRQLAAQATTLQAHVGRLERQNRQLTTTLTSTSSDLVNRDTHARELSGQVDEHQKLIAALRRDKAESRLDRDNLRRTLEQEKDAHKREKAALRAELDDEQHRVELYQGIINTQ